MSIASDSQYITVSPPVSPSSVTFTTTNWDTAQTVTVTSRNGSEPGAAITHTVTSNDAAYNGIDVDDVRVLSRPVANAGSNRTVDEGADVTLTGSGASDIANDTLTYAWRQTGGITRNPRRKHGVPQLHRARCCLRERNADLCTDGDQLPGPLRYGLG